MHICFEIASSASRYKVMIAPGAMDEALAAPGERVVIADAFLGERLEAAGIDPIVIHADERAKSLDQMAGLIGAMRDRGTTRGSKVIAIGGGVVQDAASFAASVYMRGIEWAYIPTTLLAMADSCIGGKSSINVGRYKNIVGTIHPPTEVIIDPDLAGTLSPEQVAAGLCEAAKIALCRGAEALERYFAIAPTAQASTATLTEVIALSLQAKKWFIEIDEFDRGERLLLNFGHTFGHAIEAESRFAISHGIGVGLGMLAAFHFGEALGRDYRGTPDINQFRRHIRELSKSSHDLSAVLGCLSLAGLLDAFRSDKKHSADAFALIVLRSIVRALEFWMPPP